MSHLRASDAVHSLLREWLRHSTTEFHRGLTFTICMTVHSELFDISLPQFPHLKSETQWYYFPQKFLGRMKWYNDYKIPTVLENIWSMQDSLSYTWVFAQIHTQASNLALSRGFISWSKTNTVQKDLEDAAVCIVNA